jgi:taurine dioxygenase
MLKLKAGPRRLRRYDDGFDDRPYERFGVTPLSPTIGAVIDGVDLATVDDELQAELHRALLEWKVLFFRDQDITPADHRAFAARWGELEVHPFLPSADAPDVVRFAKDEKMGGYENVWHSDVSWRQVPSLGSVLRAVTVPPVGGDTLWCDMAAAYDGLPTDVKERIEDLVAVHDFTRTFSALLDDEEKERKRQEYPPAEHPVVRIIPETGRRVLYVNRPFTSHILGMSTEESDELLELLVRQADVPEYQCRFHWSEGSVAFWDNRTTQHYAVSDYHPQVRVMERATIIGDRPVGPKAA